MESGGKETIGGETRGEMERCRADEWNRGRWKTSSLKFEKKRKKKKKKRKKQRTKRKKRKKNHRGERDGKGSKMD